MMKNGIERSERRQSQRRINWRISAPRGGARRLLSIGISALLSISTFLTVIPQTQTNVYADDAKTIVGLGTGPIDVPDEPETKDTAWSGSYVWYGSTAPNKYRVLAPHTTTYNDLPTMLLDCDTILERKPFDNDSSTWYSSELKGYLNGVDFLNNNDKFTAQERGAIAESTVAEHDLDTGDYEDNWFEKYVGLGGEKIFLLDYEDVMRPSYGYYKKSGFDGTISVNVGNHIKKEANGNPREWWLRSRFSDLDAGFVEYDGVIARCEVKDEEDMGVSPAFNINLSSVIFTSLISGEAGEAGAAYKLTVKDDKMEIETTGDGVTRAGNVVTVPYKITGNNKGNATQVSVLLMDHAWTAGEAVTEEYNYFILPVENFDTEGAGTFTLTGDYATGKCGTDYYAYIVAEDVNTGDTDAQKRQTDYASEPLAIDIPVLPSITTKSLSDGKVGIEYSQTLTAKNSEGKEKWSITDGSLPDELSLSEDGKVTGTPTQAGTFEFTVKVEADNGDDTKALSIKIVDKDTETCKVVFDANGHGEDFVKIVTKGDTVVKPDDPKAEGYDFGGWYTDKECTTAYDFGTPVTEDITVYAMWTKKDEPEPEPEPDHKSRSKRIPRHHDDDDDDHKDEPVPSEPKSPINYNALTGVFYVNGASLPGVSFAKQVQGPLGTAALAAGRPAGHKSAFTFNMAINGKTDYTLKKGVLCLNIPAEYQKMGRTFDLTALDKNGKCHTFKDVDNDPTKITGNIEVEGYAFDLTYRD